MAVDFQANAQIGLTEREAQERLKKFGLNQMSEKKQWTAPKIFFSQLSSPLMLVLIAAAGASGVVIGDWADSSLILLAVGVSTSLGFFQEFRAEKALFKLKSLLAPKAKVIRDGKPQIIESKFLVPGDVTVLEIGRIVPADGRIIEADSLFINEAILTGESMPVDKQVNRLTGQKVENVFMGTSVAAGIGRMEVLKTGDSTKIGGIAGRILTETKSKTPLMRQVASLARGLTVLVVAAAGTIFTIGWIQGREIQEMFKLAISIAVASVPEGLAVSLTAILAIGMQKLLKRKALVHRLASAETLGSVTVILSDKTGTLTEGKMRVTGMDLTDEKMGRIGLAVCNDLRDPLEIAMFDAISDAKKIVKQYPRLDEIPFSPNYKYIATLHQIRAKGQGLRAKEELIMFISGAPEVLLDKSTLSAAAKNKWLKKFEEYGSKGLRLVALAYKNFAPHQRINALTHQHINNFSWLGIVLFEDPVRPAAAEAIARAQSLGLKVKVLTGDYLETTVAVINKLKVKSDPPAGEAGKLKVDEIEIFARMSPEEKLNIVKKLQAKGEVVAMMGDGVNDAPALKAADIGIVVESASDVSKETADLVLIDNNFYTIVEAVIEGRKLFLKFQKVMAYLLSDSMAEVIILGFALLAHWPLPLTALMILWINLISDGLPAVALTLDDGPENGAGKQSQARTLLDGKVMGLIVSVSVMKALAALFIFKMIFVWSGSLPVAQTAAFVSMGVASLMSAIVFGSFPKPITAAGIPGKWVWMSVMIGLILLLIAVYLPVVAGILNSAPVSFDIWKLALGGGLAVILTIELVKYGLSINWLRKSR